MSEWSIDRARRTYAVPHWGEGYFDIDAEGGIEVLPRGGEDCFAAIRQLCQPRLAWSDEHWQQEIQRYRALWQRHHGLPDATP